jgi:hypothetical protein
MASGIKWRQKEGSMRVRTGHELYVGSRALVSPLSVFFSAKKKKTKKMMLMMVVLCGDGDGCDGDGDGDGG